MSPGSSVSGTVTYNGNNVHEVKYQRLAALVSSLDVHLPSLTVRETLEFARDCSQAFGVKDLGEELKEIMGEALKHGQDPKMELNFSMMGLKRVADRPVGNPTMPSLTEFQRHRLTTAEMFAGTYAVYIFDQLNAGGGTFLTMYFSLVYLINTMMQSHMYAKVYNAFVIYLKRPFVTGDNTDLLQL